MSMAVPSAPAENPSGITLQQNTADAQAVSVQKQDKTKQLPPTCLRTLAVRWE